MAGFDPKKLRAEEEYGGFAVGATSDDSFLIEVLPEYPSIIKSGRAEEDLWANPEEPVVYEEELPLAPEDALSLNEPQHIPEQEQPAITEDDRLFFEEESQYNTMEQEEMAEPAEKDEFDDILKGYQIPPVQESPAYYAPPPPEQSAGGDNDLDDDLMDLINQSLGGAKSKPVDKPAAAPAAPVVSQVVPPTPPTPVDTTPTKVVPPTPPTPTQASAPVQQPQSYAEIMEQNISVAMSAPDFEQGQENVFTFDGVMDVDQPSKVTDKSAQTSKKQTPPPPVQAPTVEQPQQTEKPRKKRVIPMWVRIAAGFILITLSTSGIGFSLYYTGLWEQWFGSGAITNADGTKPGSGNSNASPDNTNIATADDKSKVQQQNPPVGQNDSTPVLPEDTMDIASFDAPSPIGTDSAATKINSAAEKQTLAESSPPPSALERTERPKNRTLDKPRTPAAANELRPRTIKSTPPKTKKTELAEEKIVPPRNARGLFVVQMYSSPSREDAEAWVTRLRKKGVLNPHIQPQTVRNQTWYRVRFGTYATQAEAEKDAIAMGFADSWVVRLR